MNNRTHEMFPIGNGNFYALIKELSIKEIYAEHGSLSFCSLEHIKDSENIFTKSQRIFNSPRWHTRVLELINCGTADESLIYSAEIDDRVIIENNLFIRSIKNKEPIFFKLKIPPYAKLVKAPLITYEVHKAECFWIKIAYENYEEILQISLCGECKFDRRNMIISAPAGESAIIFSIGTIPATIQRNSARALHLYLEDKLSEGALPFKEEKNDKIRNVIYSLVMQSANGRGMTAGSNDSYIRMLPVYAAVKLFTSVGISRFAKTICVNSLRSFLSVKDCAAVGRKAQMQFATDIFSLTPSLLWLSAFEAPDEGFLKNMTPFMTARTKLQAKALIGGMLTFEGREYYYKNFCPITDGSAISTLLFIKSTELVCKYSEDKEIKTAYENAKNSFRGNFISNSKIYLNSPKRTQNARLPKFIYGRCDFCNDEKFTWLTKNSAGAYCCDECAEQYKSSIAPNFSVLKESYLPALWAVYVDLDIFTKEEIHYSQELALWELDSMPLCDLGLLLNSMNSYHHKAQRQVYDLVISKMNSLDIWYNDAGEFDTLTNAVCAYAVNNAKSL